MVAKFWVHPQRKLMSWGETVALFLPVYSKKPGEKDSHPCHAQGLQSRFHAFWDRTSSEQMSKGKNSRNLLSFTRSPSNPVSETCPDLEM